MKFIVYGRGCSKCQQLAINAEDAARTAGVPCELSKVTDMNSIIDAGIMLTPALSVDDQVVCEGKVASVAEITKSLARLVEKSV